MAKSNSLHVAPRESGWGVRKSGASRATSLHKTQEEAVTAGRELARKQRLELYIHGKDGRIREKHSYGGDPFPPKG